MTQENGTYIAIIECAKELQHLLHSKVKYIGLLP